MTAMGVEAWELLGGPWGSGHSSHGVESQSDQSGLCAVEGVESVNLCPN